MTTPRDCVQQVQDAIREDGLNAFAEALSLVVRRHSSYPNLVMLKYDQIRSPMADVRAQQCRGLILDESNDWAVVSFPYAKFFNWNEPLAPEINWESARVYEKLDGSIMTLYHYDGRWHVASNGSPDAGGGLPYKPEQTFRDLFWETWKRMGYELPCRTDMCFMFELTSPHNKIIVAHEESTLTLHGARMLTGDMFELWPEQAASDSVWEHARQFDVFGHSEVVDSAAELDGSTCEGYVVCDAMFRRVKVKSPHYVRLHRLKDSVSELSLIETAQKNEGAELCACLPEFKEQFDATEAAFRRLCADANAAYEANRDAETQKDFALRVKHMPFAAALFSARHGKHDRPEDWLRECDPKKIRNMFGVRDV